MKRVDLCMQVVEEIADKTLGVSSPKCDKAHVMVISEGTYTIFSCRKCYQMNSGRRWFCRTCDDVDDDPSFICFECEPQCRTPYLKFFRKKHVKKQSNKKPLKEVYMYMYASP
jgi:hypothetical protein